MISIQCLYKQTASKAQQLFQFRRERGGRKGGREEEGDERRGAMMEGGGIITSISVGVGVLDWESVIDRDLLFNF